MTFLSSKSLEVSGIPAFRNKTSLGSSCNTKSRLYWCVCVNSTSRGEKTLATPAFQGWLACVPLPLGAAVNKIKGATLTPPDTQAKALRVSASLAPGIGVQMVLGSVA